MFLFRVLFSGGHLSNSITTLHSHSVCSHPTASCGRVVGRQESIRQAMGTRGLSCRAKSLHEVSILGDHKMISRIKKIRLVRGNDEVEIQFDLLFSFHGRSMSKSSSEIDEEGACADDERGVPGVDVDARGPGGMTALHLASCRGTYGDGSSLDDDKDSDDSGGAMVSDLLSLGANYVSKTDLEETPLHLAARHSRADVAKRLLDYGADANARERLNRTPLHLAIGADAQGVFQVNNIYYCFLEGTVTNLAI